MITTVKKQSKPGPARQFFTAEDEATWGPELYKAGYLGLSLRTASYGVGCSMTLLATTPEALAYFHQGVYNRNIEIEAELNKQIQMNEEDFDFEERPSIRVLKQNAIKLKLAQAEKREASLDLLEATKQQTKAIEKLSDEVLRQKLDELKGKL